MPGISGVGLGYQYVAARIPLPVLIICLAAVMLVIVGSWISFNDMISGKRRGSDYIGLIIILALLVFVILMMIRGSGFSV
jgi:hypothetical protein